MAEIGLCYYDQHWKGEKKTPKKTKTKEKDVGKGMVRSKKHFCLGLL